MRTKVCGFDKMEREHAGIDGFNWGGGEHFKDIVEDPSGNCE